MPGGGAAVLGQRGAQLVTGAGGGADLADHNPARHVGNGGGAGQALVKFQFGIKADGGSQIGDNRVTGTGDVPDFLGLGRHVLDNAGTADDRQAFLGTGRHHGLDAAGVDDVP